MDDYLRAKQGKLSINFYFNPAKPWTNCNKNNFTASGTEKCALQHIKNLNEFREGEVLFVTFCSHF